MNKIREKILLIRIQNHKDSESFSELYNHLVDPIYRFVYFKVDDIELARDITADVFLKAWKQLTNRSKSNQVRYLRAFIYVIARNTVIDYYRTEKNKRELPVEMGEYQTQDQDVKKKIEDHIDAGYILKLVRQLKTSYQEVLILRHIEELSLAEIAKVLEKKPVATRVLLHRAQQALKREYEKIAKHN